VVALTGDDRRSAGCALGGGGGVRVAAWRDGVPERRGGEGHGEEMERGRGAATETPWSWRRARSKLKVPAWGRLGGATRTGQWQGMDRLGE